MQRLVAQVLLHEGPRVGVKGGAVRQANQGPPGEVELLGHLLYPLEEGREGRVKGRVL